MTLPTLNQRRSWTLDDTAAASNPGNLLVDRLVWVRHYPMWPLTWGLGLLALLLLGWVIHWSLWIAAIFLLAINVWYWVRVQEHFSRGCANPSVVVGLEPMLVAVSTDLTKGYGEYPAVKIVPVRLTTAAGKTPKVGSRLAAVALYYADVDTSVPHWTDFDPRPVDCATSDIEQIERVMNTFTDADWDELETLVKNVPTPYRPGLYCLWGTA
ncbi:MAG: DUF3239 domain-containing protein [Pirellulales bacterium]